MLVAHAPDKHRNVVSIQVFVGEFEGRFNQSFKFERTFTSVEKFTTHPSNTHIGPFELARWES